ncbi:MAG: hypothetical protein JNK46_16630 [Methylobacteriaceae bacterium]|nr:hypothetical protein [Methylobacteriaceae bacterium]
MSAPAIGAASSRPRRIAIFAHCGGAPKGARHARTGPGRRARLPCIKDKPGRKALHGDVAGEAADNRSAAVPRLILALVFVLGAFLAMESAYAGDRHAAGLHRHVATAPLDADDGAQVAMAAMRVMSAQPGDDAAPCGPSSTCCCISVCAAALPVEPRLLAPSVAPRRLAPRSTYALAGRGRGPPRPPPRA